MKIRAFWVEVKGGRGLRQDRRDSRLLTILKCLKFRLQLGLIRIGILKSTTRTFDRLRLEFGPTILKPNLNGSRGHVKVFGQNDVQTNVRKRIPIKEALKHEFLCGGCFDSSFFGKFEFFFGRVDGGMKKGEFEGNWRVSLIILLIIIPSKERRRDETE